MPPSPQADAAVRAVRARVAAGFQALAINTIELARLEKALAEITRTGANPFRAVFSWDVSRGFRIVASGNDSALQQLHARDEQLVRLGTGAAATDLLDPGAALRAIIKRELPKSWVPNENMRPVVVLLYNFHGYLKTADIGQAWLNACIDERFAHKTHGAIVPILVGANIELPQTLENSVSFVPFPLPGTEEVRGLIDEVVTIFRDQCEVGPNPTPEELGPLIQALRGMPDVDIRNVYSLAITRTGALCGEAVMSVVEEYKAQLLERTAGLRYCPRSRIAEEGEVGGFAFFKQWLHKRRHCYSPEGIAAKLDKPRGVIIVGAPGVGKSLIARAAAKILGRPHVDMDIGSMFESLVGKSEQRMRNGLAAIDALGGCVLRIDEADKAWRGVGQSNGDSGVSQRLFGYLLSWLADRERDDPTFVIMTMNRTDGLPPELLRAGRFDAIFCTELPSLEVRQEIFKIHFESRGVTLTDKDYAAFARQSDKFVGAEIEQVVRDAILDAFDKRGKPIPTHDEVCEIIRKTTPLAKLDESGVNAILDWCQRSGARSTESAVTIHELVAKTGRIG